MIEARTIPPPRSISSTSQLMRNDDSSDNHQHKSTRTNSFSETQSSIRRRSTRKLYESASSPGFRKTWQHQSPKTKYNLLQSTILRPLPDGPGKTGSLKVGEGSGDRSKPRPRRRLINSPLGGTKVDLSRLEKTQPLSLRQPRGSFESRLPGRGSSIVLAESKGGGVGSQRVEGGASPRLASTVQRLMEMEACLKNLDKSVKELRSGGSQINSLVFHCPKRALQPWLLGKYGKSMAKSVVEYRRNILLPGENSDGCGRSMLLQKKPIHFYCIGKFLIRSQQMDVLP